MTLEINKICQCGHEEDKHRYDVAGIPYCAYCNCKDIVIVAILNDKQQLGIIYQENYPTSDDIREMESKYCGRAYQTISPRKEGNDTDMFATYLKLKNLINVKANGEKKSQERLY